MKKENPLISVAFNIFIPVFILKNGSNWFERLINNFDSLSWLPKLIGSYDEPSFVFGVALLFPILYFISDFIIQRKINFISIFGFINILLTGGIGVFGARMGLSKNWFIMKEGLMPLILGASLLIISRLKHDYMKKLFLNDMMFKKNKIEIAINGEVENELDRIINITGYYFIAGFFISSVIQFVLASIIVVSNPGDASFNQEVSTMTWVSYLAVFVPTMFLMVMGFLKLVKGLEKITGMKQEDFLRL